MATFEWCGEHNAGGWHAVRQQLFDERFQLFGRFDDDAKQEGIAAGEVVALLHDLERGYEFEKRSVPLAVAGEADEGGDGEAEGIVIEFGSIALDYAETLQLFDPLGGGGSREPDAAA